MFQKNIPTIISIQIHFFFLADKGLYCFLGCSVYTCIACNSPYDLEVHSDEVANSSQQHILRARLHVLDAIRQDGQLAADVKHQDKQQANRRHVTHGVVKHREQVDVHEHVCAGVGDVEERVNPVG